MAQSPFIVLSRLGRFFTCKRLNLLFITMFHRLIESYFGFFTARNKNSFE